MEQFKDRIIEFKKVRAGDILENKYNWRRHPDKQTDVMKEILSQYGKIAPLLAFKSEELGYWCYIDGHLRTKINPDETWWICYTDLNDQEAKDMLGVYDFVTELAEKEQEAFDTIREQAEYEKSLVDAIGEAEKEDLDYSIFEPATLEEQGRLDQLEPKWVICPECGKEFDARQNEK